MILRGADSATPKPERVTNERIWGVYVAGDTFHIWTHAEVAALKAKGVEGVLPIAVPPQKSAWWVTNVGYAELEALVREALAWGLPEGSPLCLDVEEGQSEKFGANAVEIARAWAVACRTHKLIPWAYGGAPFLDKDAYNNRWLAEWPNETPVNPEPPEGYRGWQYAGNIDGIDLDVFLANEVFLSPDLKVVTIEALGSAGGVVSPSAEPSDHAEAPVNADASAPSQVHIKGLETIRDLADALLIHLRGP